MDFRIVENLINQYDSIVIYRHVNPDCDAAGSAYALKLLIEDNFENKDVYCYGNSDLNNDLFEKTQKVGLRLINRSLAFVLDSSTIERVDDDSFLSAKEIISIDHHLNSEKLSQYQFVDSQACSTAFLICQMAIQLGWKVSKKAADCLYAAISTDTVKLTIDKVNKEVMETVGFLLDCGIDIKEINRACYDIDINGFKARNYFMNKTIFTGNCAYFYCEKKERETLNVSMDVVKEFIDCLSNIKGVDKYFIFYQDDNLSYNASLRSHKIPIVQIAKQFGGGGHALASGAKGLSLQQTLELTKMMVNAN